MRTVLRPFLAIALGLVLAVTGQSMATARGASAATGQIVLCIGTDIVTVYTDAKGQPTAAPHICPDCILAAVDDSLPSSSLAQAPDVFVRQGIALLAYPHRTGARYSIYASRAPPLS